MATSSGFSTRSGRRWREAARRKRIRRAKELLAEEVLVLPLSPVLDIVVFSSAKVGGG